MSQKRQGPEQKDIRSYFPFKRAPTPVQRQGEGSSYHEQDPEIDVGDDSDDEELLRCVSEIEIIPPEEPADVRGEINVIEKEAAYSDHKRIIPPQYQPKPISNYDIGLYINKTLSDVKKKSLIDNLFVPSEGYKFIPVSYPKQNR